MLQILDIQHIDSQIQLFPARGLFACINVGLAQASPNQVLGCVMCVTCFVVVVCQTDLSFGKEYTAAVEAKQVGEFAIMCYGTIMHVVSTLFHCFSHYLVFLQLSKRLSVPNSLSRKLSRSVNRKWSRQREKLKQLR